MKNLRSRSFLFVFFLTLFLLAFAWLSSTPVRIQGFESIQKYEDREVLYQQFSLLYLIVTTPLILLMVFSVVQYSIGKWLFDKIYLMYRQLPRYFFSWICPIAFIIFSALTAFRIMGATPRILDGFNYLFQAQNMALGQFTANIPPVPEFFQFVFIMMQDGRWYGSVYPGFPLILALGVLIRAPWLVNPVLGGIGIHLTFRAGKAFFNTETAKLTVLLMTFSPFYRMMASIFMSHISAMIGSLVAIWMIWIWITKRNFQGISVPFAAGTAMGYVYITRPQAGMVVIPFIIYAIVVFLKRSVKMFCSRMKNPFENQMSWHRISVAILFLLLPMIGSFLFLSFYNLQVTGEAFVNPRYLVDPQRSLGFGDSLGEPLPGGLRSGHSLGKGIHNISVLLRLWNSDLLGWGSAGLLGIPIILVILCFGDREFFTLKILLGVGMLFVLSLYLFYYT
ncbi:glycosyltransferase family 39 protein, partial [bacterium]|nr:glycosyltransferase family 39 protein [candidate division CSSED10-310 bacterium]